MRDVFDLVLCAVAAGAIVWAALAVWTKLSEGL